MKTNEKQTKIFILDDNQPALRLCRKILEDFGHSVITASGITEANRIMAEALWRDCPFDVALIDLHLDGASGGEFGRRVIDIARTKVVIVTGDPYSAAALPYEPTAKITKPYNLDTMQEEIESALQGARLEPLPCDIAYNLWQATAPLAGFNKLRLHSRKVSNSTRGIDVEKVISVSDAEFISTVIYHNDEVDHGVINIALSSLLGCPIRCAFCKHWHTHKGRSGEVIAYKRALSIGEIVGQGYLALNRPRVMEALKDHSGKKINFNFTCEGDGLVFNLDNCMAAIKQLAAMPYPQTGFIITSVGNEKMLEKYLRKYASMPNIRHYWSLDSLHEEVRSMMKPGTTGDSLLRLRDLYQRIAEISGQPVTVSWVVIPGINDLEGDANLLASYFKDRPFEIKLMKLVPGSLGEEVVTTDEDIRHFSDRLRAQGIKDVRYRDIIGSDINAGCGNTVEAW